MVVYDNGPFSNYRLDRPLAIDSRTIRAVILRDTRRTGI